MPEKQYGKYTGIVSNNRDEQKRGRLEVTVDAIFPKDEKVTAIPAVPYGFFFVPEIGAKVWIEFEGGDTGLPIWTGIQYQENEWATEADLDPPQKRVLKTAAGHVMLLNDKTGEETVQITDGANKHVVTMNKSGIEINDGVNGHSITLNESGIEIKASSGHAVALESSGVTISVQGGAKIQVTAEGVTVDAGPGKVDIKGTLISLSGTLIKLSEAGALPILRVSDSGVGNLGAPVPLMGPGNTKVLG